MTQNGIDAGIWNTRYPRVFFGGDIVQVAGFESAFQSRVVGSDPVAVEDQTGKHPHRYLIEVEFWFSPNDPMAVMFSPRAIRFVQIENVYLLQRGGK